MRSGTECISFRLFFLVVVFDSKILTAASMGCFVVSAIILFFIHFLLERGGFGYERMAFFTSIIIEL
jgi:hypothetical protein